MQFIDQSGAGTESVFGGAFKDDPGGLELKHDRGGLLSMANTGPDSNTSHFSIVVAPAPHLNGKCGSVYIAACTTSQIYLQVCNILLALAHSFIQSKVCKKKRGGVRKLASGMNPHAVPCWAIPCSFLQ